MNTIQSMQWLRENNLFETAKKYSSRLKNVFLPCLKVQDEKILIVGDKGFDGRNISAILSGAYYLASQDLNLDAKLIFQEPKSRGDSADDIVIDSFKSLKEGSVMFLNMSDKLGSLADLGKSFRKWANKRKHRFVSAMSLGDLKNESINHVTDAIDINYKPMQSEHESVIEKLNHANEIHVTTKAGTDLIYDVSGIKAIKADGNYTALGTGGNLPAGEVYIPPNKNKVNGKVVIDASSRNHRSTLLVKKPITLTIEEGKITQVEGGSEAEALRKTFEWAESVSKYPGSVRRICEFGVGLNPKAKLLGAMIIDEKVKGTAHIGIGSNYWFGGKIYAIIHLDQVFKNPQIFLDGKELII